MFAGWRARCTRCQAALFPGSCSEDSPDPGGPAASPQTWRLGGCRHFSAGSWTGTGEAGGARAGGPCPRHRRARPAPSALSPREHGRVHVRRPVPVSPGWERRGAQPHTASLHACLSSVDARKCAFGGECHSARVSGWHAGTPLRLRVLCASVRKRAEARVRGPDGPGREPSALSIPGSARRSA